MEVFCSFNFCTDIAIFAVQNAGAVEVRFLTFELSVSQALVILISAVFGALVALMLSLIRWLRAKSKAKNASKTINKLEQENKQLKTKLEEYAAKIEKAAEANDQKPHDPTTTY
ncbi:MAG: LapA family protein [Eubacteriales bacterium]|nr:LapA family protein [Eubacteriales bacterium]